MSDFDKVYDAAMAEARAVDKEARRRWQAVQNDPTLTAQGKQPKFAEVDAWRAKQVDALQNKIALELAGEKAALRVEVESRQRAAAKAERARLAEYPATALLLAERELAVLSSAELVQRVAQLERNGDGLVNALDRRGVATQMHNAGLIADPSLFEAV